MPQTKRDSRARAREAIARNAALRHSAGTLIKGGRHRRGRGRRSRGPGRLEVDRQVDPAATSEGGDGSVIAAVTGCRRPRWTRSARVPAAAPQALSGNPVRTVNGKPSVLYVGAEYCPFCAAERWGMIVALSRFEHIQQPATDLFGRGPHSDVHLRRLDLYESDYMNFQPVEMYGNKASGNSYDTLQPLSADQKATFAKFNSQASFPFVDFGNQAVIIGSSYQPTQLSGKTQEQVAGSLASPSNDVAKAVDGTANAITAQICKLTNNQPSTVCSSKAVQAFNG